ncbi:MAG: hypothetical protein LN573_02430 [Rickettsia endosymbiont of Oxypoda opaca]|nr:hypothetical protein [Rickettsia endosymbiont of Oxypoda opaca]
MISIKQLYTLLFGDYGTKLEKTKLEHSIKVINNSPNLSDTQKNDIFIYAISNNKSLTNKIVSNVIGQGSGLNFSKPATSKGSLTVSEEEILEKFYTFEKTNKFFGFSSSEAVQNARNSISKLEIKIAEVSNIYKNIATKNIELSTKKLEGKQKLEQDIQELENKLNKDYIQPVTKIAKHELARSEYIKLFKLSKLIADYIENNNTPNNGLAYKHAYNMVVCFGGDISSNKDIGIIVEEFLKVHGFIKTQKPIYDTFAAFTVATQGENVTLKKWQELINKHGKKAMGLFAIADLIEQKLADLEGKVGGHIAPKELSEAQNIKVKLTYKRADEYPELAKVSLDYNLNNELFDKCLDIEKRKKKSDNLPDVIVHGAEVSVDLRIGNKEALQEYHIVKLPINDPRAYILGKITDCCQSVGGHSEECVIDGITRENNGFYVLLKNKKKNQENLKIFKQTGEIDYQNFEIVGQGYTWLSDVGNLTFDSWENLRNQKLGGGLADDGIIVPLLRLFAEKVCETTDISRVTIGTGGKTPNLFKAQNTLNNEENMKEGFNYVDAQYQVLIGQKKYLTALQAILDDKNTHCGRKEKTLKQVKEKLNIEEGQNIDEFILNYYLQTKSGSEGCTNGFFTYEDLKSLQITLVRGVTSENAISGYKNRIFTFDVLKDLSLEQTLSLTTYNAFKGFEEGYFTFDVLKGLSLEKLHNLTTDNALKVFKEGYFTFDVLKDLSLGQIHSLTTDNALKGFEEGYFMFDDLKGLEAGKMIILITFGLSIYQGQDFTSQEQNDSLFKEIKDSISKLTLNNIQKIINPLNYKVLISTYFDNVIDGHREGHFKIDDLAKLEAEKIKGLVSRDAIKGYRQDYFKFDDLVKLEAEKIKLLTSKFASCAYSNGWLNFNKLKDLSISEIEILTSEESLEKYDNNICSFEDLLNQNDGNYHFTKDEEYSVDLVG